MLENIQGLLHPRCKYPRLLPKQQHHLCHCFKKIPTPSDPPPSWMNICDNRPQLFLALLRLTTTAGQSSSPAVNTHPRYIKSVIVYSVSPYGSKSLSVLSISSAFASLRHFCSAPLAPCAVSGCLLSSVLQGTIMSYQGHRGWGTFLSSKMTTVSRTYWCRKWTRITVLVAARPGNPSTGQLREPPLAGNAMR